jgi:hypothetical protein
VIRSAKSIYKEYQNQNVTTALLETKIKEMILIPLKAGYHQRF